MAKILYVCFRPGYDGDRVVLEQRVRRGAERLALHEDSARVVVNFSHQGILTAILNPPAGQELGRRALYVGAIASGEKWDEVGAGMPDGACAICRSDYETAEFITDSVGSRTLWWFSDESMFIASTSQRWIISLVGGFQLNDQAIPWLLSSGTLGPQFGFDKRLAQIPPASILKLDINRWQPSMVGTPISFTESVGSDEDLLDQFCSKVENAVDSLDYDHESWVLTLSGGHDSRAILAYLRKQRSIRSITWGTAASIRDRYGDAAIASLLASRIGIDHSFLEIEPREIPLETVINRFIRLSEGRIDHISGYLDGFNLWETLVRENVERIVRGDIAFNQVAEWHLKNPHHSAGLVMLSDYSNIPRDVLADLAPQALPKGLLRAKEETHQQYCDRLYQEYRIPTAQAALSELKTSFVEIANPLLFSSVVLYARTLPDRLRRDKNILRMLVERQNIPVPYASRMAVASVQDALESTEALELLQDSLDTVRARQLFSAGLRRFVSDEMGSKGDVFRSNLGYGKRWLRKRIPFATSRRHSPSQGRPTINVRRLAFRMHLAASACDLFEDDGNHR